MGEITSEDVLNQLRTVNDPELQKDFVSLNMVKDIAIEGSKVTVKIELTTPACPLNGKIREDIEQAIRKISGVETVEIELGATVRSSRTNGNVLKQGKNVVAVGAGKEGVGKSTVAVMLALGLRRAGASVGLLDADIYGPSIPKMTGCEGDKPALAGDKIVPIEAFRVKIMSMGFLLEPGRVVVWRGPMVHGAVKQFIEQVDWGELDYLIVDLPPGTGDAPLTLSQSIPMTGAVTVCTPQDIALADARRAIKMYEQLNVPSIGIVENMSYYLCPKCGHRDELFDHGGAAKAAEELGVPFLGEIPLNAQVRIHGDAGTPDKLFTETEQLVRTAIDKVVSSIAGQISVRGEKSPRAVTLSVE